MNRRELSEYLNALLPHQTVADFCPNGLQVEGKKEINKIGTAVTANLETIRCAIAKGIDALIVHHGLFWKNDSYVIQGIKREKIQLLLENAISLYAFHLPLDLHREIGNNWKAAIDMGWTHLEPFGNFNGTCIGVKGVVPSLSKQEFQTLLENYYQHPATYAAGGPDKIQKVALISGGAHKSISEAAQEELDAFVTGSFDEPTWYTAKEEKIHFFGLGHSATERIGPRELSVRLKKDLAIECIFIDVENQF